ncbi:hypothetical protein [Megalodesulfovibrio paquesii]
MRFTEEDLLHIAASCREMAAGLAAILEDESLEEADRLELMGRRELLHQFSEAVMPVSGASLVDFESEDRFEHPRRTREAFQTMARDLSACRMLAMRKMLAHGAVSLAAILADGDVNALEDLLTRLGFLTFNA